MDIARATQMTQLTQEQLSGVRLNISDKQKTLYQLQDEMWIGEADDGASVTIGVCLLCRCDARCVLLASPAIDAHFAPTRYLATCPIARSLLFRVQRRGPPDEVVLPIP